GPPPSEWLGRSGVKGGMQWGTPSNGLALSGGIGISSFSRAGQTQCGTASSCNKDDAGITASLDPDFWAMRFVAAHIGYLRPSDVTTTGSGTNFHFDSVQHTRLLTVGAKGGKAFGPARLYVLAGVNRHQATITTNNTIDDTTVTVDNVTRTLKGGSQTYARQTEGWNWAFGGGVEAWLNHYAAFYGEFQRLKLTGKTKGGGEGDMDDHVNYIAIGARFHLGPKKK